MKRILLLLVIAAVVIAFFALDLDRHLTLDALKQGQAGFAGLYAEHPWQVLGAYFAAYVVMAALSLPGAAIMTIAAGTLFGLLTGLLLVSFASSIGATLAFLVSRFLRCRTASVTGWARSTAVSSATAPSTCSRCAWCRCFRSS
jgi:uncharacterized membrane protein YdjX (TVP38/TMEM64 family)